jgi:hypothetical protein
LKPIQPPLDPVDESSFEPCAEADPEEPALALPPVADELFELEADADPEPVELAFELPLDPAEAFDP